MAIVNEIVTKYSFVGNTSAMSKYNKALGVSIKSLGIMGAAMAGATALLGKFVLSTNQSLDPMIQLSRTTGVAVETIQELGYVASVSGSSMSAIESTVASLSQTIGTAAQMGSEDFARLGISVRNANGEVKSADQVLGEVSNRFKQLGLSEAEKISFAGKLGIDKSLIQLLNRSGAEMDSLRSKARALGTITKRQADAAASLNDSMTTLKFGLGGVKNQIAVGLAPEFKKLSDGLVDFLIKNKDAIQNGISKTIEAIKVMAASFKRLLPLIIAVGAIFTVAFAPISLTTILIAGGLALVLLAVDDLMVAFSGGQSVIADFFKEFFNVDIVELLKNVGAAFKKLFDYVKPALSALLNFWKEVFGAIVDVIRGDFSGAIDHVISAFSKWYDYILNLRDIMSDLLGKVKEFAATIASSAFSKVAGYLGFDTGTPQGQKPLPIGGGVPSRSVSSNTSNRVNQDVKIEIRTDNPVAAGTAVKDALNDQLESTYTHFNRRNQ